MDGLFGAEGSLIVRFVVAFVIVLALIGAKFWIIRRFGATRVGAAAQRGRQPRLAVIDAALVDGRRRLVLVRRDNVEHLLMIGGPSDIVVEQNIVRAVPVTPPRDVPAPRASGMTEGGPPPRALAAAPSDEDAWAAPPEAPVARPEPMGAPSRCRAAAPRWTVRRSSPAPLSRAVSRCRRARRFRRDWHRDRSNQDLSNQDRSSHARSSARSRRGRSSRPRCRRRSFPSREPADAALASMAQRLEAALRRPGAPEGRPGPGQAPGMPAPDLAPGASIADLPEQNGAKPKSVLDSLEEEMASLLGRPPEKQ